jgi:hypothetical protein
MARVTWIVRLVETSVDCDGQATDVMEIAKPGDLGNIANLGLSLAEAKQLLAAVQREVVAAQARDHATRRPTCRSCGAACHVKDYRQHCIATLFGQVTVRLPRFRCPSCGRIDDGVDWPSHGRSTPELDGLQAHLSALMTYRTAAEVLEQMFPVEAGKDHESLRRHTLTLGEQLQHHPVTRPTTPAAAISISMDSTFIRSCEGDERHLEVRVGNVETDAGGRQVFGAVVGSETDLAAEIGHTMDRVGCTETTVLTGFTDGCAGLRSILAGVGVVAPPILDWFHISMRLQHLEQAAGALSTDTPERQAAKAMIVTEVDRLRWRLWNGKAKGVQVSIARLRTVMHAFQGEVAKRPSRVPSSRKLWTALLALDGYLAGQADWMVNYAERHRAGLRVGIAITEGTANFLVNRRMNKSQQMRWSCRGADLLLRVRCAVYNGTFGSGFGQRFVPANDTCPGLATAA